VLTAHPKAYPQISGDQLSDIPLAVPVKRAFAVDTSKAFAFKGRYLSWMALPDRWVSWLLGAVPAGLRLIREYRPKVLWSTYPIATAHLIGFILHRLTNIPWIADFRDPMTEIDPVSQQRWPGDPALWKARQWVESLTVKYCARAVFVTPGARRIYEERYPHIPSSRWKIVPNGYDEDSFHEAEKIVVGRSVGETAPVMLLHSGTLYPSPDRDPTAFFAALTSLRDQGKIMASRLRVVLRGSGHEDYYRALIHQSKVEDLVTLEPLIPYREALAEMLTAHGLLLFQGHDSNPAIPAKLYEYFRAGRPIFAMVDPEGDTACVLREAEIGVIAPMNAPEQIALKLTKFLNQIGNWNGMSRSISSVRNYSRQSRTSELAYLFENVLQGACPCQGNSKL